MLVPVTHSVQDFLQRGAVIHAVVVAQEFRHRQRLVSVDGIVMLIF
jgi:hypothetical protein